MEEITVTHCPPVAQDEFLKMHGVLKCKNVVYECLQDYSFVPVLNYLRGNCSDTGKDVTVGMSFTDSDIGNSTLFATEGVIYTQTPGMDFIDLVTLVTFVIINTQTRIYKLE